MPRRTTAVSAVALMLLPLGQPLLVGTLGITTATTAVVLHQGAAIAQDASAIARIAKAITVRIEGSTQGSGVIVKREGNRYTVLTAWHVVSGNQPGEEVDIYTLDGQRYPMEQGSIKRIKETDTATLTFSSSASHPIPSIASKIAPAEDVYIFGFPLDSPGLLKASAAKIIGNTNCQSQVASGSLLYKVTVPKNHIEEGGLRERYETSHKLILHPSLDVRNGMSGGPIFTKDGLLVGHHNGGLGGASDWGVATKMGLNRGSLTPGNRPHILGYVNPQAVCAIISAQDALLEGMHSDAATFALDAYRSDPKTIPFISNVLNFSLLKLGRFGDLCELHAAGAQLNNGSLDLICQSGVPEFYGPR